ncbi:MULTISPECIES: YlxR family protein [Desulfosediminicola]|uniref:YlxR family protein n=1 Tax=Desulfosediminicola TaxID=2886823 RepID=UPI0010ACF9E2
MRNVRKLGKLKNLATQRVGTKSPRRSLKRKNRCCVAEPVRTCVACGRKDIKSNLQRFVWRGDSPIIDETGRETGRGAYCCKVERCLQRFVKQNKKWKRVFRL